MFVQEVVNYYLNNIPYFINKECYILTEKKKKLTVQDGVKMI